MKTTTNLIFTLLNLLFISAFSQQKIKVIDLENNQPISYAKVILEDGSYRNTETDGSINIFPNEKIIEIQSFGYEILKISEYKTSYFLTPKFKNIDEVIIEKPLQNKFLKIGNIKKEMNSQSFVSSNTTWTIANFVENKEDYNSFKYIKSIKFRSKVEKINKNATINLLIFKNENGKPSDEIWKSFIVQCKPGKNITIKDFDAPILFPKEGIFIGFEWIINDENSFEEKIIYNNLNGKKQNTLYKYNNPFVYSQKSENNQIFIKSKNVWKNFNEISKKENRALSIEVVLSN
ncbi:MAG: hypothetical protein ACK40Y_02665 [Cloacibacterium caeni]